MPWLRLSRVWLVARTLVHSQGLSPFPSYFIINHTCHSTISFIKLKEEFASYYIKQLLDSDFGRKSQMSTTGPPPATTPPAISPASFASPSPTPGPSAPASANTPIYPTHTSGTGIPPGAYMQPSGATPGANMQLLGPTSAACIHLPGKQ